jgi:hypothetical protein
MTFAVLAYNILRWMGQEKANAAGALWCHTRPGKMETLVSEPLDGTDS